MSKKKIIIGILIIIIAFIIVIFFAKKNKQEINNTDIDYVEDTQQQGKAMPKEEEVKDKGKIIQVIENVWYDDDYFNIKNILENYYNQFTSFTENFDIIIPRNLWNADENAKKKYLSGEKKARQISARENLYNKYGEEYKKEFGIKEKNNIKIDSKYADYSKIMIESMKEAEIPNNIILFFTSGKKINVKNKQKQNFCILVAVDYKKMAYSIYPEEYVNKHNYNKLKNGDKINIEIESIENNEFNTYGAEEFTEADICKEYFESLKDSIIYEVEDIYNIIDSEYKKARFNNSKDKFYEYIQNNKEMYNKFELKKYTVHGNDYICVDNFNNQYKFRRKKDLFDYTIFLDNYSIVSSTEQNHYKTLNNKNKSVYQLKKFIRQINTRDYDAIYNHLNNEYKDTSFKNIEELKKYINTNFYRMNESDITNNEEQTDYNVLQCNLINMENKNQKKKMYVIIKLEQDMNYTMSFSFE